MDTNMKEKFLIAQPIIHGKIVSEGGKVHEFDISNLRKSCMLASQRYKQDLKEQRAMGLIQVNSEESLKRKTKFENLKRRKTDLQNTIDNLRKSFESETLEADKEQNVQGFTKTASFLKSIIEKEKPLKILNKKMGKTIRNVC